MKTYKKLSVNHYIVAVLFCIVNIISAEKSQAQQMKELVDVLIREKYISTEIPTEGIPDEQFLIDLHLALLKLREDISNKGFERRSLNLGKGLTPIIAQNYDRTLIFLNHLKDYNLITEELNSELITYLDAIYVDEQRLKNIPSIYDEADALKYIIEKLN